MFLYSNRRRRLRVWYVDRQGGDVHELTAVRLVLQKETVWSLWPEGTLLPVFVSLALLTACRF
jgi:hypothetical protein